MAGSARIGEGFYDRPSPGRGERDRDLRRMRRLHGSRRRSDRSRRAQSADVGTAAAGNELCRTAAASWLSTGDFAHRPVLGPVQAMNFVDLLGAQHGSEGWVYGQNRKNAIALFFSSTRRSLGPVAKLFEDKDLHESYVVLFKIGYPWPQHPNFGGRTL